MYSNRDNKPAYPNAEINGAVRGVKFWMDDREMSKGGETPFSKATSKNARRVFDALGRK